jgi:hypothetical protein
MPGNAEVKGDMLGEGIVGLHEMLRRIPAVDRTIICAKLLEVTDEHLALLGTAMTDQRSLLSPGSLIKHELFPFVALKALQTKNISTHQFGTIMRLWGYAQDVELSAEPIANIPEFVPFFNEGEINPRAKALLLPTLDSSGHSLSQLIKKSAGELMVILFTEMQKLPKSEQGFWVVQNTTDKARYRATPVQLAQTKDSRREYLNSHTVKQQIIGNLRLHYLDFPIGEDLEIIPSFGLQQVFLNAAFDAPVSINPVIGASSVADIRLGSLQKHRDVALPFPGMPLPKVADEIPAPRTLDFMYHDWYHCIRASRVTPEETIATVAIGDRLNLIQERLDDAVKKLTSRHRATITFFADKIRALPKEKKEGWLRCLHKEFNKEERIIAVLRKLRKGTGQLKFRQYDMERSANGTADESLLTIADRVRIILGQILFDIGMIKQMQDGVILPAIFTLVLGHAILDAIQLEQGVLESVQYQIREIEHILTSDPIARNYIRAIYEGPTALPAIELDFAASVKP